MTPAEIGEHIVFWDSQFEVSQEHVLSAEILTQVYSS